jgi:hypothetical protein
MVSSPQIKTLLRRKKPPALALTKRSERSSCGLPPRRLLPCSSQPAVRSSNKRSTTREAVSDGFARTLPRRPGGSSAAGAASGVVIAAATAAAWAASPPGYCWYYTDPSPTQGFWDVCPY